MVHGPEPRTEQGGESRKTVGLEPTHIKCRVAADDSDNDGTRICSLISRRRRRHTWQKQDVRMKSF